MKQDKELYKLIKAIKRNNLKEIEMLTETETEIDINGYYLGKTPLCIAAMNGSVPVIKLLIEKGADINKPTEGSNFTPLSLAVSYDKKKAAYFLRNCGGLHEEKNVFAENLKKVYPDIDWQSPYDKKWNLWDSPDKS